MLLIFTIFFALVTLMINMKRKVVTVDLDKSKVKLKLAPALRTSGVWGLGGHHAGDQGHLGDHADDQGNLGDRDQRGFGDLGSCQKSVFDWRTRLRQSAQMRRPGRRAGPW